MALRRLVPTQDRSGLAADHGFDGAPFPDHGFGSPPRLGNDFDTCESAVVHVLSPTISTSESTGVIASTGENGLAPTLEQLVQENATLREAFSETNKRLLRLEDERSRFFDEGIFDIVNAVCVQSDSTGSCDDVVSRFRNFSALSTRLPHNLSGASHRNETMDIGIAGEGSPPVSPGSVSSTQVRYFEEKRSAELSSQNAELRAELAKAGEVGESLELQQRAAEDRTHVLEQERARLMERLRECTASIDGTSLVDATEIGSSEKTALKAEEADLRKRLEAAIEAEKAHNLETCERLDRYQAEFNSAQSRMEDELSRQRDESDRIISDLDSQTQELERKLRDSEEQARSLADENARLAEAANGGAQF